MLDSYKAIFFDAGGTLLHPYPSVGEIYFRHAVKYGCSSTAQDIERIFHEVWQRRDGIAALKSHADEKSERNWWRSVVREVFDQVGQVQQFDDFFEELYMAFGEPDVWRLYPETLSVIQTLKAGGKRLAIVSNWDSRLFQLVDGLNIRSYFEFVLASAVVGSSKPSPFIFEEALRKMRVEPSEAIHVGDSLEDDVKGASDIGISAVWINRKEAETNRLPEQFSQVQVIRSLSELLASREEA